MTDEELHLDRAKLEQFRLAHEARIKATRERTRETWEKAAEYFELLGCTYIAQKCREQR